ncbi:hypothetical protein SANA_25360 [Gottschalkiaceae bacterium SANA]|nr:hypothetical protein SANA_25360 [Gottschalkiaceae bacterium SANA]
MLVKLLKILAWIIVFPFMLTYWGWKRKKKLVMVLGAILSVLFITIASIDTGSAGVNAGQNMRELQQGEAVSDSREVPLEDSGEENLSEVEEIVESQSSEDNDLTGEPEVVSASMESAESQAIDKARDSPETNNSDNNSLADGANTEIIEGSKEQSKSGLFDGYRLIEVDGRDLSGHRESNVVVDIGFGDREYYAFTNEFGQLVKVVAEEIILQDDATEPVLSTGRYFSDEAKVPGVESPVLDEGHVIADSLGGVSNAYNITPQDSTLNRHGDQAYMEDQIRKAGGCTDFVAIITYQDAETQIPSHYSYKYTLKGNVIEDDFDNVNPDEINAPVIEKEMASDSTASEETTTILETDNEAADDSKEISSIRIKALDKVNEYIIIENTGDSDIDLAGWKILSVLGSQEYEFAKFILNANSQVMIGGYKSINKVDMVWEDGRGIWNNNKSDPAELYDSMGTFISCYDD